jgi:hypothetical protein
MAVNAENSDELRVIRRPPGRYLVAHRFPYLKSLGYLCSGQEPTLRTMQDRRKRYLNEMDACTAIFDVCDLQHKRYKRIRRVCTVAFHSQVTLYQIGAEWASGRRVACIQGESIPIVDRLGYENKSPSRTSHPLDPYSKVRVRPSDSRDYRSVFHHVGRSSCAPTQIDPVTRCLTPMTESPCSCKTICYERFQNVCRHFRCTSKPVLENLLQLGVYSSSSSDGVSSSGGDLLLDGVAYRWETRGVVLHISETDEGDPFRWSNVCDRGAFWKITTKII